MGDTYAAAVVAKFSQHDFENETANKTFILSKNALHQSEETTL